MATTITHYDVGDIWVPQATFAVSGVNTDPTNLTVRQQDGAGVETVLLNNALVSGLTGSSTPVAKTATGVFKLNPGISLSSAGHWFVKFEGAGAAAGTEQQEAIVDPDEFTSNAGLDTQALVSLSETKDFLKHRQIKTDEDLDLVRVINAMSDRFIYETGGREFKATGNPQARDFELLTSDWILREVEVGDMASVTSAQLITYGIDGTVADTTTLSNLIPQPRVRPQPWSPITSIKFPFSIIQPAFLFRAVVRVTGNYGFPAIPESVKQAVLNAVAAVVDRDAEHYRQDFGQVLPSSSAGGEAGNVILMAGRQQKLLTLPPASAAVAASFRGDSVLV